MTDKLYALPDDKLVWKDRDVNINGKTLGSH